MPSVFSALIAYVVSHLRSHQSLRLENMALRHQLAVYQHTVKRPKLRPADRLFWSWLSRLWSAWQDALAFVQPRTVIAWQKRRFRDYWRQRSQSGRPGRPRAFQRCTRPHPGHVVRQSPVGGASHCEPVLERIRVKTGHNGFMGPSQRAVWCERLRRGLHIQNVVPKPFEMSREIRAQARQQLGGDTDPISLEVVQHIGHVHDVLQHHHIGHQIPILDPFFLLDRVTATQDGTTKGKPLRELVIGFDLGRFGSDMLAHGGIRHILQQKNGALDPAQFAKGFVQMCSCDYTPRVFARAWRAAPSRPGSIRPPASYPANSAR